MLIIAIAPEALGRPYCILYIVYCKLYIVYCIQYTVYCIQITVYSLLHTVYCILYIVHCVLYTVYCIHHTVYCKLYTVYSILYTAYCIQFTTLHYTILHYYPGGLRQALGLRSSLRFQAAVFEGLPCKESIHLRGRRPRFSETRPALPLQISLYKTVQTATKTIAARGYPLGAPEANNNIEKGCE